MQICDASEIFCFIDPPCHAKSMLKILPTPTMYLRRFCKWSLLAQVYHSAILPMVMQNILHLQLMIMLDLLHLPISLLSGLPNKSKSVNSDTVSFSISIYNEQHQACDVLELHEAESDGCCASSRVPVLLLQRNGLGCWNTLCLVEAKNVGMVGVDVDGLGSHWDFVVVFRLRWEGGDLR